MEARKNMKKRKSIKAKIAAAVLCAAAAALSAGCGRDTYEVEYGVDGYVYVSKKLQSMEGVEDMQVVGGYLYYMQYGSKNVVSRVSVAELAAGEGRLDFSKAKALFSFRTLTFDLPEGTGEDSESGEGGEDRESKESGEGGEDRESKESGEGGEDRESGEEVDFLSAMDGVYGKSKEVSMEKSYGRLTLEKYAAAPDGTLCLYFSASTGGYFSQTPAGGVLCRQDPDGKQAYKVYVTGMLDVAMDAEGRGIALTGEGIRIMDGEGNQTAFLSTEEYHAGGKISKEELFTDSEGRVYYTYVNENSTMSRATYEITGEGPFRLKDAGAILGEGFTSHSAAPGGDVYQFGFERNGCLCLYDRETGSQREILNWLESGLLTGGIRSVAGVTPEILLVSYSGAFYGGQTGIYQLTKTSVEELPERELLVIATPGGSAELQKAAMLFNASSSTHRVVLESYGGRLTEEGWEIPRLDASLVSSNPPDILDLRLLNTVKYARMGVLEDLGPYLEDSSIDREDIPENVIEGFTFDGRLVALPAMFSVRGIGVRASQVEGLGGWAMEDLYRMTEQHPESMGGAVGTGDRRVGDGYEERKESSWLLGELCVRYYLEEFIDWEEGECRFDSEEFCDLIEWAGTYGWEPGYVEEPKVSTFRETAYIADDVLMVEEWYIDLTTLPVLELQCGEEACLRGYPTADGRGYYPARSTGGLGICINSSRKEAAWEFIELYRKICMEDTSGGGLPASKKRIRELYEEATTPDYTEGKDGESIMREKIDVTVSGDVLPYYFTPKDQADAVLHAIETADFTPMSEEEETIVKIVVEETESYYSGDKSLEEVAGLIQNRVQLILNEGR